MKKIFMLVVLNTLAGAICAQDNIVIQASKMTTMEKTPKEIIDSLTKRFPNAESVQYYQTSKLAAQNGWKITEQDNLDVRDDLELYTLSFKRDDFNYFALFSADGTLLKSKYQEFGKNLSEAAKTSLKELAGSHYQDYYIESEIYFKIVNHKDNKSYYEVVAKSKKDAKFKKIITLDEGGKVVTVR